MPEPEASFTSKAMARDGRIVPAPPPTFEGLTPISIMTETRSIIDSSIAIRDRLAANLSSSTASFSNLIRPLANHGNRVACRLKILGTLVASVSPDSALREASRAAKKLILAAETVNSMRTDIASLVAAVHNKALYGTNSNDGRDHALDNVSDGVLDAEDRHLIKHMFQEYLKSGAGIQDEITRFLIQSAITEMNKHRAAAQKDLTEAADGLYLTRVELTGIPNEELANLTSIKDDGGNTDNDQFWLTFRAEHSRNIMLYACRGEVRRKFYLAKMRRFPENVIRLEKIIVLRDKIARLLGYENHASLKMEERMAYSVDEVKQGLLDLKEGLEPLARAEIENLLMLKSSDINDRQQQGLDVRFEDSSKIFLWDWAYYARVQRTETQTIDSKALAEYFEAKHTFKAMLEVFAELFGMEFQEVVASVWHEDVTVYAVWNSPSEGGGFLGYLYEDIFQRTGKYQGAHHLNINPGFVGDNETRQYPASALICSFRQPTPGQPTLLLQSEVRTMFHELGHAIHNIVSRTKYSLPHSRDFIEIPSLMLEHFTWVPEILTALGKHHSSLEMNHAQRSSEAQQGGNARECLLSHTMAEAVARTKFENQAFDALSDVQLALFDLTIHSPDSAEACQAMDTTLLWNSIRQDNGVVSYGDTLDEMGFGQGGFPHIFRTYDAGYFAYSMSLAYAADIYSTKFSHDPLDQERGMRYRYSVLQPGSSRPEIEILDKFLGRQPNLKAYIHELVTAKAKT